MNERQVWMKVATSSENGDGGVCVVVDGWGSLDWEEKEEFKNEKK